MITKKYFNMNLQAIPLSLRGVVERLGFECDGINLRSFRAEINNQDITLEIYDTNITISVGFDEIVKINYTYIDSIGFVTILQACGILLPNQLKDVA